MIITRMDYEKLLCTAYECGRDNARGIDADCYDGLIAKESAFKRALETSTDVINAAYEFGIKVGEISTQINLAIERIISGGKFQLSEKQLQILRDCKLKLIEPNPNLDVDRIDGIIAKKKHYLIRSNIEESTF